MKPKQSMGRLYIYLYIYHTNKPFIWINLPYMDDMGYIYIYIYTLYDKPEKTTGLKRNIIFQRPSFSGSMLQRVGISDRLQDLDDGKSPRRYSDTRFFSPKYRGCVFFLFGGDDLIIWGRTFVIMA